MEPLAGRPTTGRVFDCEVAVRFGDCSPGGRLRLDALARILQDAGNDDFADAGLDPSSPWVARRSAVAAEHGWPTLGQRLRVSTWCGGLGARWAERRSSVSSAGGDGSPATTVEVATVWVHVDAGGRPARLPPWFVAVYGPAAGARTVSSRLRLPHPRTAMTGQAMTEQVWQVRATDLDVLGHVNNAVLWAPIEQELADRALVPVAAELEFPAAVRAGEDVRLVTLPPGPGHDPGQGGPDQRELDLWLMVGDEVRVAGGVRTLPR